MERARALAHTAGRLVLSSRRLLPQVSPRPLSPPNSAVSPHSWDAFSVSKERKGPLLGLAEPDLSPPSHLASALRLCLQRRKLQVHHPPLIRPRAISPLMTMLPSTAIRALPHLVNLSNIPVLKALAGVAACILEASGVSTVITTCARAEVHVPRRMPSETSSRVHDWRRW